MSQYNQEGYDRFGYNRSGINKEGKVRGGASREDAIYERINKGTEYLGWILAIIIVLLALSFLSAFVICAGIAS